MPIVDGQPVNASVTNNEKLDKQSDDTAFGKISLQNSDPQSGGNITNVQRGLNQLFTATGADETNSGTNYPAVPNGTVNIGENHELSIARLARLFHGVTGHNHDGTDGNGPSLFVPPATTGSAGGVVLPSSDPLDISGNNSVGDVGSNTVAMYNHTHKGVRSLSVTGDPELFGDFVFIPGEDMDVAQSSGSPNEVMISNPGFISHRDSASGVHGVTGNVVGTTDAQPLSNKSIQDPTRSDVKKDTKANLTTYAATATNGQLVFATDEKKMYQVVDNALKAVGGGGQGGVNFLTLTTAWAVDSTDSSDFESSVGNWVTYNDASAIPVDLTGGTATDLTLSRTTTAGEILDGVASLKLVKAASSAQGQGISCVLNVPPAYSGKRAQITLPFRVLSGSIVSGDLLAYIYDVTSAQLITPFNNVIVGSNGTLVATFDVPNSTANVQMRLGLHFATTSATAVTLVFDDISVGYNQLPIGSVTTPWQSYTPTFTGFGTVTVSSFQWRLSGDAIEIRGGFTAGTTSGTEARISLPAGYSSRSDLPTVSPAGYFTNADTTVNSHGGFVLIEPSVTYMTFGGLGAFGSGSLNPVTKQTGPGVSGNGSVNYIIATIPIASVNATITQSSTFLLSSVLANGTRVTTTPARLGEYRSQLRNAGANTFTDTNGTPATLPSAASGIAIYSGNTYASADTNNNPTRYEFFIGRNKNWSPLVYSGTNRSGIAQMFGIGGYIGSNKSFGYVPYYNSETGVLSITALRISGTGYTHSAAVDSTGDIDDGALSTAFLDIIVSESAQPMAVVAPNSSVALYSGQASNGSTNTTVRRFGTVARTGNALTVTQSSTLGDSVTVNESGVYGISFGDEPSTSGDVFGVITVNGTALTTDAASITYAQGARSTYGYSSAASGTFNCSTDLILNAGDVIRFQRTNARIATSDRVIAIVTQLAKL